MHAPALTVNNRPSDGDVLITTQAGSHLISVVPYPHRITFANLQDAMAIARKWASTNGVSVWHHTDGQIVRVGNVEQNPVSGTDT
jgi:hypothetical protein